MTKITITYQPILNSSVRSTRYYEVTEEMLIGLSLIATLLIAHDRIQIQKDNGDIIDLSRIFEVTKTIYPNSIKFGNQILTYHSLDFLAGALEMCNILGVDPSNLIIGISIVYDHYYRKLSIPNTSDMVIDLKTIILNYPTKKSLDQMLTECFPISVGNGVIVPCTMYLDCIDPDGSDLRAVVMATSNLPEHLKNFTNSWYLFNVCARSIFRGKGITKSLLICALNDLIQSGVTSFILEVLPTNTSAYKLYTGLGFIKIAESVHEAKQYDVMKVEYSEHNEKYFPDRKYS